MTFEEEPVLTAPLLLSHRISAAAASHAAPIPPIVSADLIRSQQTASIDETRPFSGWADPLSEVVQLAPGLGKGASDGGLEDATRSVEHAHREGRLAVVQPPEVPNRPPFAPGYPSRPLPSVQQASSQPALATLDAHQVPLASIHGSDAGESLALTEAEAKRLRRKIKNREHGATHRAKVRALTPGSIEQLAAKKKKKDTNSKYYAATFKHPENVEVRTKAQERRKIMAPRYAEANKAQMREKYRSEREALGYTVRKYTYKRRPEIAAEDSGSTSTAAHGAVPPSPPHLSLALSLAPPGQDVARTLPGTSTDPALISDDAGMRFLESMRRN